LICPLADAAAKI